MGGRRSSGAVAWLLVAGLLPGCLRVNPGWEREDDAGSASTAPGTTFDTNETGAAEGVASSGPDATTGEASAGGVSGTTGDPAGTTTAATGATADATSDATADATSDGLGDVTADATTDATTGAPLPGAVTVVADIAACVLLSTGQKGQLGPAACEAVSSAAVSKSDGVMAVDTALNEGGEGRPAHAFLRFAIPGSLAGKTIDAATLRLHVIDDPAAGSDTSGLLQLSAPFDLAGLDAAPQPAVLPGLDASLGATMAAAQVDIALPVEAVQPGSALHLRISPTSDDGVAYANGATEPALRPTLELAYH